MFSVLTTWLLSLRSKVWIGLIAGGALLLSATLIVSQIFAAGREREQLAQANSTIKQYKKEVQIEADIRSLDAAAARQRLRDKWRKR